MLLTLRQAADRLPWSAETLRRRLSDSDRGVLIVRGQLVQIDYMQSGAKGQGRISIDEREVARLADLFTPRKAIVERKPHNKKHKGQYITVPLGRGG